MKKCILYFSLPALIMWAATNVYASSCNEDIGDMRVSIQITGYVMTKNGIKIKKIYDFATSNGDESCEARGKGPYNLSYSLSWERGDWRSTIIASDPTG
ncbi:hypothetical protein [Candidatus Sororendozoicomonas aggregata]|uniref:hypothetical protein n=1 Tax=Candidatus Sororendozoicomonas aggregata TaxID=3073239 RepID=UPI002ED37907